MVSETVHLFRPYIMGSTDVSSLRLIEIDATLDHWGIGADPVFAIKTYKGDGI